MGMWTVAFLIPVRQVLSMGVWTVAYKCVPTLQAYDIPGLDGGGGYKLILCASEDVE